jgi:hypothetical protein
MYKNVHSGSCAPAAPRCGPLVTISSQALSRSALKPETDVSRGLLTALAVACLAVVAAPTLAAGGRGATEHGVNPESGVESWQFRDDGVEILLQQIGPDQARAFFLGRGFQRAEVDHYASSCVFMTLVKNTSARPLHYRLDHWRYLRQDGVPRRLKLKHEWLREWKQRGTSPGAMIAFEWSQHPAQQTLEPGDWNQGMTTFAVPHGERFDLDVKWKIAGRTHAGRMSEVLCAK